jgi:hypothetical protein
VALAAAVALVSLAAVSALPDGRWSTAGNPELGGTVSADPQGEAVMHAEAACMLTSKAEQAAEATVVDEQTRYAAAVLLLDQAIIESARAVQTDTQLADLDTALQSAHAAGHRGDHDEWEHALRTARAECRTVRG